MRVRPVVIVLGAVVVVAVAISAGHAAAKPPEESGGQAWSVVVEPADEVIRPEASTGPLVLDPEDEGATPEPEVRDADGNVVEDEEITLPTGPAR